MEQGWEGLALFNPTMGGWEELSDFSPQVRGELPGEGVTPGNAGPGMTCPQLGMDSGCKPGGSPKGEENGAVLGGPVGNSLGFIPCGTQLILGTFL